jgi:dipeptidyl aminopeptidase/acylaminoacyl peptidase
MVRKTAMWKAAGVAVLAFSSALFALEKWTIDEIIKLKRIENPLISPDGRHVLYALTGSVALENREYSDLWVTASDGSVTRQLTHSDAKETSPQWTPDSKWVSYIAAGQVWRVAPDGGEPKQVTSSARNIPWYAWSPDGSQLLYTVPEPKSAQQIAHEKNWGIVISPEEEWPEHSTLWVANLASKQVRKLTDGKAQPGSPQWSPDSRSVAFIEQKQLCILDSATGSRACVAGQVHSFAWSPDGKTIAYIAVREEDPPYVNYFPRQMYFGFGRLWLLDVATRKSRQLTRDEYQGLATVTWSRDSSKLVFLAKPPGSQGDRTAMEAMYILPADGSPIKSVAPGFDFLRGGIGITWTADNKEIWFLNGERMGYNVFGVDALSGKLRHVTTGQDVIGPASYTQDFQAAAYVRENVNTKPDLYVAKLPHWEARKISDINPEVRKFAQGPGEIVRYPSEGREIEALFIKPPDFDRSKKYPLLLIVHGGPTWYKKNDWCPEWEMHPIQAYAAQGYCLIFPNVRGSADYGREFRQANYHDLGGGDFRDAMAAVDYLIRQGFIDESKLGVAGWSYGGYLTPAIITKTDRFKAAQFGAGIPSFEAMYSRLSTVEFLVHENYGTRPWEDAQTQIQDSPLYSAMKVKTPTLIEHGEEDPRCPVGGSILFYKALKFYGVPAVLEIYPKEGHGISGPLLHRRCLHRNLEWFNKWLKGDTSTSFEKLFPTKRSQKWPAGS